MTSALEAPVFADAEEYGRAVRYSRTREWLAIVGIAWGWLVDGLLFFSGGSAWLRARAGRATSRPWLADALYLGLLGLVSRIAGLPLAYYRGFVVEHRFGLSRQRHHDWATDQAKGAALELALGLPISLGSYAVIRRYPHRWWLVLSGLALPFTVVLAQLYPVLIAPIFNRFVPVRDPVLGERVRGLAERAGVHVAEVVEMDMSRQTRKANAFFAGLGPTKRIALGDTLVTEFTPDEVEVIVAHELGHQVHLDVWKGIALGALSTLGGAYLLARIAPPLARSSAGRSGVARLEDIASAPLLGLLLGLVSVAAMPLANAFSRRFVERPADRYALSLTGRPEAFASAMVRLARLNLADPDPPWLVKVLLHSHPTIAERVAFARSWQN